MSDNKRFWVFEGFACGRDGNELSRRVAEMALARATEKLQAIDPNWSGLDITFGGDMGYASCIDFPLEHADACRLNFDYRPKSVILKGPKQGHVDVTAKIFTIIPEPLVALMHTLDQFKPWFRNLYNPKHEIELIEGRTIVKFENCMRGVVRCVRGEEFYVELFEYGARFDGDVKHYSLEQLKAEINQGGDHGQAVDVDYFPCLRDDGTRINDLEELRERWKVVAERERVEQEVKAVLYLM
jgi:hypothetical protein